jgi:Ca2+-binding RTX toxin-like protein
VKLIVATGGDGNDYLGISERYGKISTPGRLFGGNGVDRLVGGSGADTLVGDADNDRIYAGPGNDSISGGGGTDRMWGQAGKDIFVGYKRIEVMDLADGDILKNS